MRNYDLLLGPPLGWARLSNRLDEAAEQFRVELAAWREEDAELEALWILVVRVQDLVLGGIEGPSSLGASMSMVAELLEGRINAVATNGVCWGSRSALVTAVSYFLKLKTKLEVLRSRHSVDLIEDEADAL
jgi:hypothetical protein